MPKPENCSWYPGKISKIRLVEVVVGVSLVSQRTDYDDLALPYHSWDPVHDTSVRHLTPLGIFRGDGNTTHGIYFPVRDILLNSSFSG